MERHHGRGERHSRERTALRPHQSSVSWRQSGPHRAAPKHFSQALEAGRCHPCAANAGSASSRPRPGRKASKPQLSKISQHSAAPWRWKAPRGLSGAAINSSAMGWPTTDRPNLPNSNEPSSSRTAKECRDIAKRLHRAVRHG